MRISDWSSDVCSSDLPARKLVRLGQLVQNRRIFKSGDVLGNRLALGHHPQQAPHDLAGAGLGQILAKAYVFGFSDGADFLGYPVAQLLGNGIGFIALGQIGRASCRERVCQYVSISVVAVSLKKKERLKNY